MTPFVFSGCSHLLEILGPRARDERELMEILEHVPAGTLYFHTHRRFGGDPRVLGPYANDFADWVASEIGDGWARPPISASSSTSSSPASSGTISC